MFGNGGLTNRLNTREIAIRGLSVMGISTRGGLVTIGNTVPNPGNKVIILTSAIGDGWREDIRW